MKQTAVDILFERLSTLYLFKDAILAQNEYKKAKQIEKEQIMNAYKADTFMGSTEDVDAEQYYNETFKSE